MIVYINMVHLVCSHISTTSLYCAVVMTFYPPSVGLIEWPIYIDAGCLYLKPAHMGWSHNTITNWSPSMTSCVICTVTCLYLYYEVLYKLTMEASVKMIPIYHPAASDFWFYPNWSLFTSHAPGYPFIADLLNEFMICDCTRSCVSSGKNQTLVERSNR